MACEKNISICSQLYTSYFCTGREAELEPRVFEQCSNDQIELLDCSGDNFFFFFIVTEHLGKGGTEKSAKSDWVLELARHWTPVCVGSDPLPLGHARFLLDVFSLCSIRSAQNALVQMMATRSHRIPCLLSATKGNTDSADCEKGRLGTEDSVRFSRASS